MSLASHVMIVRARSQFHWPGQAEVAVDTPAPPLSRATGALIGNELTVFGGMDETTREVCHNATTPHRHNAATPPRHHAATPPTPPRHHAATPPRHHATTPPRQDVVWGVVYGALDLASISHRSPISRRSRADLARCSPPTLSISSICPPCLGTPSILAATCHRSAWATPRAPSAPCCLYLGASMSAVTQRRLRPTTRRRCFGRLRSSMALLLGKRLDGHSDRTRPLSGLPSLLATATSLCYRLHGAIVHAPLSASPSDPLPLPPPLCSPSARHSSPALCSPLQPSARHSRPEAAHDRSRGSAALAWVTQ